MRSGSADATAVLLSGRQRPSERRNDKSPLPDLPSRFPPRRAFFLPPSLRCTHTVLQIHPALIKILSNANGTQSLFSLNTNSTLFTLHPTYIILDPSLVPYDRFPSIENSALFSSFFHVLLDGDGFAPPRWEEPTEVEIGVTSPLQRALLSPLLRPHQSNPTTTTLDAIPPLTLSRSRSRSVSSTLTPLQSLLLPSASNPALSTIYTQSLSHAAEQTAERIMELRRAHDAAGRRLKAELELLECRAKVAGMLSVGGAVLVKGFSSPSTSRSPIRLPDEAATKEDVRERSTSRGRRARSDEENVDEETSRRLRATDEGIAEARGRSTSRTRRDGQIISSPPATNGARPRRGSASAAVRAVNFSSIAATMEDSEGEGTQEVFVPHAKDLVAIPEAEELSLPSTTAPSPTATLSKSLRPPAAVVIEGEGEGAEDGPFEMDEDIDSEFEIIPPFSPATNLPPSLDAPASPVVPTTTLAGSWRPGSYRPSVLSSSYATLLSSSYAARRSPARTTVPLPPPLALNPTNSFNLSLDPPTPTTTLTPILSASASGTTSDNPSPLTVTTAKTDALIAFINTEKPDPVGVRLGREQARDALALDSPSHRDPLPSRARRTAREISPPLEDDSSPPSSPTTAAIPTLPLATTYAPSSFPSRSTQNYTIGSLPISIGVAPPRTFSNTTLERSRIIGGESGEVGREEFIQNSLVGTGRIVRKSNLGLVGSAGVGAGVGGEGGGGGGLEIGRSTVQSNTTTGPSSLAQSLRNPPASFGRTIRLEEEREAED